MVVPLRAQESRPQDNQPAGPKPARVEITPRTVEMTAGQQLTFSAIGCDEAGNRMEANPTAWFATPFDYVDGHHVYLTDNATGSLRVIHFADPATPKEVARWQTENPLGPATSRAAQPVSRVAEDSCHR
jgi:hypothetical protein